MSNPLEGYQFDPNKAQPQAAAEPQQAVVNAGGAEIAAAEPTAAETTAIDDNVIFSRIKEKIGRDIANWEDLNTKPQPSFANTEIENINKYISETGRTINDYMALNKDWSKVDDRTLVMDNIRKAYPTLSDDEVSTMYDDEYGQEAIDEDEDYDDRSRKSIEIANKKKALKLKTEADKVRKEMNALKQQYSTPLDNGNAAVQERAASWQKSMDSAIGNVSLITEDGFKFEFADKGKFEFMKDINSFLKPFVDKDGGVDFDRLTKTMAVGLEAENIFKEYSKFVKAETLKEAMANAANRNGQNTDHSMHTQEAWESDARAKLQKFNRKY